MFTFLVMAKCFLFFSFGIFFDCFWFVFTVLFLWRVVYLTVMYLWISWFLLLIANSISCWLVNVLCVIPILSLSSGLSRRMFHMPFNERVVLCVEVECSVVFLNFSLLLMFKSSTFLLSHSIHCWKWAIHMLNCHCWVFYLFFHFCHLGFSYFGTWLLGTGVVGTSSSSNSLF